MKTMYVRALVFSALTFAAVMGAGAASALAAEPEGTYCLSDTEYSSRDCGFTSYAQCEQTASGIGADCSVNVFRDENRSAYGLYRPRDGHKARR
jgi:hypothetical protein